MCILHCVSQVKECALCIVCLRLKAVQSCDELSDVYNHFLLYYGRDIPKMQNASKCKTKKLKKIKEVDEDSRFTLCGWSSPLRSPDIDKITNYNVTKT